MCADAKKVTAGVDKVGGDVDMFGYEDGTSLRERNRSLEEETLRIEEIKGSFTSYLCSLPLENLPNEVKITAKQNLVDSIKSISKRIKNGRELQYKQEFGLQKFKTMGGEKWRDSKYVYVISSLYASPLSTERIHCKFSSCD